MSNDGSSQLLNADRRYIWRTLHVIKTHYKTTQICGQISFALTKKCSSFISFSFGWDAWDNDFLSKEHSKQGLLPKAINEMNKS